LAGRKRLPELDLVKSSGLKFSAQRADATAEIKSTKVAGSLGESAILKIKSSFREIGFLAVFITAHNIIPVPC
jgi:hypothetical protein